MQVVYQCTRCYSTVYSRHYTSGPTFKLAERPPPTHLIDELRFPFCRHTPPLALVACAATRRLIGRLGPLAHFVHAREKPAFGLLLPDQRDDELSTEVSLALIRLPLVEFIILVESERIRRTVGLCEMQDALFRSHVVIEGSKACEQVHPGERTRRALRLDRAGRRGRGQCGAAGGRWRAPRENVGEITDVVDTLARVTTKIQSKIMQVYADDPNQRFILSGGGTFFISFMAACGYIRNRNNQKMLEGALDKLMKKLSEQREDPLGLEDYQRALGTITSSRGKAIRRLVYDTFLRFFSGVTTELEWMDTASQITGVTD